MSRDLIPKKGDKLFCSKDCGDEDYHIPSISPYLESHRNEYFKAAERLMFGSDGPHYNEKIIPILFLLRHSLELTLKSFLLDAVSHNLISFDQHAKDLLSNSHRLASIWNKLKPLVQEYGGDDSACHGCESMINELHEIDPAGTLFRYPRRKDHVLIHLDEKLPTWVNKITLHRRMKQLHHYLGWCHERMLFSQQEY